MVHFTSSGVLSRFELTTLNCKDLCFEIWSNTYCMVQLQALVHFLSSEVHKIVPGNLYASHLSILHCFFRSVGTSTAAFVLAVLEGSTQPGVWFPEEVSTTLAGR